MSLSYLHQLNESRKEVRRLKQDNESLRQRITSLLCATKTEDVNPFDCFPLATIVRPPREPACPKCCDTCSGLC